MPCRSCRISGHNTSTCNLNLVKKVVDKFNKYIDESESFGFDHYSERLGKAIIEYLYIIYTKGFIEGDQQYPPYLIVPISLGESHYIKIYMRLVRLPVENGRYICRKPVNVEHAVTYEIITDQIQGRMKYIQWMTYYFIPNCYGNNMSEEETLDKVNNLTYCMNYHMNALRERYISLQENVVNTTSPTIVAADLIQYSANNTNVVTEERHRQPQLTPRAVDRPRNQEFVNNRRQWVLLMTEAREAEIDALLIEEGLNEALLQHNYDDAEEFVTEIDDLNTIALDRRRRADVLNENNRFNTRRHQRARVYNNDTITPSPVELCSLQEKVIDTDECPICMDKIGNTNKTILRCGHQFCVTCLFQNIEVISKNKQKFHCECPICRGAYYNLK